MFNYDYHEQEKNNDRHFMILNDNVDEKKINECLEL